MLANFDKKGMNLRRIRYWRGDFSGHILPIANLAIRALDTGIYPRSHMDRIL
jgi:hypothetical protein